MYLSLSHALLTLVFLNIIVIRKICRFFLISVNLEVQETVYSMHACLGCLVLHEHLVVTSCSISTIIINITLSCNQ